MAWSNHRTTLPQSRPLGVPAPSEREPGTAAPFIVPPGNRNFSGDFHRPYESSETIRPRFLTQKRYRVGQGTDVWEPAQSAIKKGGEWANSPPEETTQIVSQEGNPDMGQGEPACTGS